MKKVCVLKRGENTERENSFYCFSISFAGGLPIMIDQNNLEQLSECGGILITGGDHKNSLDDVLITYALKHHLPLLGICQGMQSMAMYGSNDSLIDVSYHYTKENCHKVLLKEGLLKTIYQKGEIFVNSYHHQQIKASHYFNIVGFSEDGVIEAIEGEYGFQIGVQWHPERMISYDTDSYSLFKSFLSYIKDTE